MGFVINISGGPSIKSCSLIQSVGRNLVLGLLKEVTQLNWRLTVSQRVKLMRAVISGAAWSLAGISAFSLS